MGTGIGGQELWTNFEVNPSGFSSCVGLLPKGKRCDYNFWCLSKLEEAIYRRKNQSWVLGRFRHGEVLCWKEIFGGEHLCCKCGEAGRGLEDRIGEKRICADGVLRRGKTRLCLNEVAGWICARSVERICAQRGDLVGGRRFVLGGLGRELLC